MSGVLRKNGGIGCYECCESPGVRNASFMYVRTTSATFMSERAARRGEGLPLVAMVRKTSFYAETASALRRRSRRVVGLPGFQSGERVLDVE
jgi:hypothetical protein